MLNRSLSLLLILLCCAGAGGSALADDDGPAYIAVTGEAAANMLPDIALLDLTVMREAPTAREALDANTAAMNEVIAAMRDAGVDDKDLQTSNFSIQPRYSRPQPREEDAPRLVAYAVRNSLAVRVRELDKLGGILDAAVTLGVNEGGGVRFENADPSSALEVARALAVKDALAKAEGIAAAAGVELGGILSIQEGYSRPQPQPMMAARSALAEAVPVAAGENTYQVTVNLRVAIKQ